MGYPGAMLPKALSGVEYLVSAVPRFALAAVRSCGFLPHADEGPLMLGGGIVMCSGDEDFSTQILFVV